jgi:hypothetical protein
MARRKARTGGLARPAFLAGAARKPIARGFDMRRERGGGTRRLRDQEPTELCTELNVPLMVVPRLWRIPMQTTTIRASITAYSTAVGPSSLARKRRILGTLRNI